MHRTSGGRVKGISINWHRDVPGFIKRPDSGKTKDKPKITKKNRAKDKVT